MNNPGEIEAPERKKAQGEVDRNEATADAGEQEFKTAFGSSLIFDVREDTGDLGDIQDIVEKNSYQLEENGKDRIVLDIGSGIGDFAIFASSLGYKVVSFEPSASERKAMHKNAELNKSTEKDDGSLCIDVVGAAISPDVKSIWCSDNLHQGGNVDRWKKNSKNKGESYRVETIHPYGLLDLLRKNYLKKDSKFHMLKIDVEGHEFAIVHSGGKSFLEKFDRVAIEIHPHLLPSKCAENNMLRQLGSVFDIKKHYKRPTGSYMVTGERSR